MWLYQRVIYNIHDIFSELDVLLDFVELFFNSTKSEIFLSFIAFALLNNAKGLQLF